MHPQPDPERAVRFGLFALRQAFAAGYSRADVRRELGARRWRRVERGILRRAARWPQPEDPYVMAALRAGPRAVVSHSSAAAVWGWSLLIPRRPEVSVPASNRSARGGEVYRADLRQGEVRIAGVLPVTSPTRTAVDLARTLPLHEAVAAVDSALGLGQLTADDLRRAMAASPRFPGRPQVGRVVDLVCAESESPAESWARVLFSEAGLPAPVCQYRVVEQGRFLGRADFAWPRSRLVVEVDGYAYHSRPDAFQRDRVRQNLLVQAGWRVLRFTVDDLRLRADYVIRQVARALAAGA